MITFYDCSTAPSPRRARILLAEKRVLYHTVTIDLRAGEQLGEAFRAQARQPAPEHPALARRHGHKAIHGPVDSSGVRMLQRPMRK